MSRKGVHMLARTEHRVLRFAVIVALVPTTAWGANVRFVPALELRAFHDGNVNNVGPVTDAMAGRATVELGLTVASPTAEWELLYAPYHDE